MSLAQRTKEMRRFTREEVCFRVEITGIGDEPVFGLIVNISPLGCMIRCSQDVVPNTPVSFALPLAGQIRARIVWAMGGRMGLEFEEEVDAEPYLGMLDKLRRPADEMGIY